MTDQRLHVPMKGLVIPADVDEPVRVIDLNAGEGQLTNLQREVGGWVDVQRHAECDVWCNDEGRLIDLPINPRVNHWSLNESQRAREGTVGESTVLYGDVVLTGPADSEGDVTPVSDELVRYFGEVEVNRDAMRDWDTRDVSIIVMDWPDDGRGLER